MRTDTVGIRLVLEAILFTLVVPGTVAGWIPWWILGPEGRQLTTPWTTLRVVSLVCLLLGVAIYIWCVWDFVVLGRGIPAPIDHPKRLVITGLYRYVRNPMYLGVLCVLIGESGLFASGTLLVYGAAWFVVVNIFVVSYEEPTLRRKFGEEYDSYVARVNRWLPRRPRMLP